MPSQQYFLKVIDDAIGELDQKTSVVTAKEQGFTEIVLKDKSKSSYSYVGPTIGFFSMSSLCMEINMLVLVHQWLGT